VVAHTHTHTHTHAMSSGGGGGGGDVGKWWTKEDADALYECKKKHKSAEALEQFLQTRYDCCKDEEKGDCIPGQKRDSSGWMDREWGVNPYHRPGRCQTLLDRAIVRLQSLWIRAILEASKHDYDHSVLSDRYVHVYDVQVCQVLYEYGVDPFIQRKEDGNTKLHCLLENDSRVDKTTYDRVVHLKKWMKVLEQAGESSVKWDEFIHIKNDAGLTALDLLWEDMHAAWKSDCCETGNNKYVQYLKDRVRRDLDDVDTMSAPSPLNTAGIAEIQAHYAWRARLDRGEYDTDEEDAITKASMPKEELQSHVADAMETMQWVLLVAHTLNVPFCV
jgi:hypothetical protein